MPLTLASIGQKMKIVKVVSEAKVKRHLEALGLITGSTVTVISDSAGNLIVRIRDSRIAINRDLALKIFVE